MATTGEDDDDPDTSRARVIHVFDRETANEVRRALSDLQTGQARMEERWSSVTRRLDSHDTEIDSLNRQVVAGMQTLTEHIADIRGSSRAWNAVQSVIGLILAGVAIGVAVLT